MMLHHSHRVGEEDVRTGGGMRLARLVEVALDAISRNRAQRGDSDEVLAGRGAAWVLCRLSMEVLGTAKRGDELVFETWCEQALLGGTTNCVNVRRGAHEILARIRTLWMSVSLDGWRHVDVHEYGGLPRGEEGGDLINVRPVSADVGVDEWRNLGSLRVEAADVDANGHILPGRILGRLVEMCLPDDCLFARIVEAAWHWYVQVGGELAVELSRGPRGDMIRASTGSGSLFCQVTVETCRRETASAGQSMLLHIVRMLSPPSRR